MFRLILHRADTMKTVLFAPTYPFHRPGTFLVHVGNFNIKKMIDNILEMNTMLYRHFCLILETNPKMRRTIK